MAPKKLNEPDEVMVVNDSPGEECRIAILQSGHLEELFTERTSTATDVGSIYKGRVINVEPAIQAAFIDYGVGINGFLHISDLHPKYFPGNSGGERTERVGKKIPRRERPPIQHALKRGQEILVQVLKEGIGTKGPTLTSYLSIPGRLLVLMPDMDRVGVSRKVEDEEKRREMRQILDSLNLPDGFGFILRTAGYGKTKTELKRDAAYLMRLWKVMEKRIKGVGAPCELYTESDLLIRTIRDVLRPSIKAIAVDSESAFERASTFLRVAAPRSPVKVIRYTRNVPIFHAFDIERQIELIHSREVPLPSGGRLVIDQTEALVAIDVNSGRSRSARDSETNAYETNCEAADEICRQLRLRDLGGLIVNDLIDMRSSKHRRLIEERFTALLKRDRAKATALKISEFGILEMTRQRMRPSIRKSHFMACPHCIGRGEIKVPDYVASDAVRHVGFLLQFDRVQRVEIACSSRVASVLLSTKRRELVRLEDVTEKRIDVRVSDAIAVDRVDYYAYDERNADIDITKLPALIVPGLDVLEQEAASQVMQGEVEDAEDDGEEQTQTRKSRRRRRRPGPADATAIALAGDFIDDIDEFEDEDEPAAEDSSDQNETAAEAAPSDEGGRRRRRRRRRRGGGGQAGAEPGAEPTTDAATEPHAETSLSALVEQKPAQEGGSRRSRRRRGRRRGERTADAQSAPAENQNLSDGGKSSESASSEPVQPHEEHPIRIHELARELQVTSREVIDRCEPDPTIHHVANALSTVSAEEADAIRHMFSNGASPEAGDAPTSGVAETVGPASTRGSRRSRRRRGRGKGATQAPQAANGEHPAPQPQNTPPAQSSENGSSTNIQSSQEHVQQAGESGSGGKGRRSRRRRRNRKGDKQPWSQTSAAAATVEPSMNQSTKDQATSQPQTSSSPSGAGEPKSAEPKAGKKPRRALYRAGRVSVSPAAREGAAADE